jgi:hypothetical protein
MLRRLFVAASLAVVLTIAAEKAGAQHVYTTPPECSAPVVHDMAYRAVAARYAVHGLPAPTALRREFTTLYEDTSERAAAAHAAMSLPADRVRICVIDGDGTLGTFVVRSSTGVLGVMVTNYGIPGDIASLEEQH